MKDYGVRINRALNYAADKLPDYVGLDEVARVAAFSPYHFHRVFLLIVGENFSQFMRKRRLEWAALELVKTDRRIIDISLDAGFESQETFSRAFKSCFEITPAKFRKAGRGPDQSFRGIESLLNLNSGKGEFMKPEIIEKESFHVIGLERTYPLADFEKALVQWEDFKKKSDAIDTPDRNCFYGISHAPLGSCNDDGKSPQFKYLTACEAEKGSKVPEGMIKVRMPKQKYACFTFRGPVSGFQSFIKNIWAHYLPESGLEVVDMPEIEVYDERFRIDSNESEMDYLIPVK